MKDALLPKLPFMRQGERISKFGAGYSKLLSIQSPMSPQPETSSPGHSNRLAQSPSAQTLNHGTETPRRMDQTYPRQGSKVKLRYDSKARNQMKMRKDFVVMQQDYQNQQMSSALGHKSTSKLMAKSPSSKSFAQSKISYDNNYYIQPEQTFIGEDGQLYTTMVSPTN